MEIATLGIKIENGDVVKATSSLNTMAVAGGKTEAATQRLTRRMALLEIEARQMDATMGKGSSSLARIAASMGVSEAAAGKFATALSAVSIAAAAVSAAVFIGRKTIEETKEAQAAAAQLEAVIRSTGGAAGFTTSQMEDMATALSHVSAFEDDAIVGAEALLATFTNIRGDVFKDATASILDLSVAMSQDLGSSAVQVGKALNDPVAGIKALQRVGVSFSESQKAVIKSLVDTGRTADAQRVILKELQTEFGGSAAAARDTLGGALAALSNAWGNLFEVSGKASQGTVNGINAITKSLEENGLSMNQFVLNTVVGWEKIKAAAAGLWAQLSTPIGPGWSESIRQQLARIDFDLSAKIHDLNAPAKIGAAVGARPSGGGGDTKQAAKDLAELQKATDKYYNDLNQHQVDAVKAAGNMRVQNAATREMIAATLAGPAAVEALTIAQAGANAVRELGVGVSDKVAASVRREAEEQARLAIQLGHVQDAQADAAREAERAADEAQRQMEQRAKELHRTISGTIEGILTDVDQHRNPFVAIFDNLKRGAIRAISDILATKIQAKVGEFLGIQMPADKQITAATSMNIAADKMLRAAGVMNGGSSTAGGIVIADQNKSGALQRYAQQFLKIGGAAYGGYQFGYGVGAATGNAAAGGIGGALAGAASGAALAGPVGAAVGGLAGLAGGIIGAADAARAAAERLRKAKEAFETAFDTAKAEVAGDNLAIQIAQTHSQFNALREALKDATPTFNQILALALKSGDYYTTLQEIKRLEDERITQLAAEAATIRRNAQEDLDVRTLRNQGRQHDADVLNKQHEDERELAKALSEHMSDAYIAQLKQNQAMEEAAVAAGTAAGAIGAFTTAVRNAPSGFKVEPYIYDYQTAGQRPGQWQPPVNPFVPPRSPMSPPMFSRSGSSTGMVASAPITVHVTVNESKTPQLTAEMVTRMVASRLDLTKETTLGPNATRAAALEITPS